MTGSSATYDSIAKLIIQLKKVECIENAFVTTIDEATDTESGKVNFEFSIKCNFVSMVEEEAEDESDSDAGDATLQAE